MATRSLLPTAFVIILSSVVMPSGKGQTIVEEPSSLLIPVNHTALFSCKINCISRSCLCFWVINNTYYSDQQDFEKPPKGFHTVSKLEKNHCMLLLNVNVSEKVNNTTVHCGYGPIGNNLTSYSYSDTAVLLVISYPPISPNPNLVKSNATHITLKWSPPFLWPGQRIDYYNISFLNVTDGSISYYRVNTTYTSSLASLTTGIHQCTTTKLNIYITAINNIIMTALEVFNICYTTCPTRVKFALSAINTSVLFKANGTPALVEVYVQLPESLCYNQKLNYTILVENSHDYLLTTVGPTPHVGPGLLKESVANVDWKQNQTYSLRVVLELKPSSETIISEKHIFYTSLLDSGSKSCRVSTDGVLYLMTTSIAIAAVFLSTIILLLICICICCKRKKNVEEKRVKDMRARLSKTMVHNPIYDRYGTGPLYESVKPPQFDSPTLFMLEATNRLTTATCMDQQNHGIHSQSLPSFQHQHNNNMVTQHNPSVNGNHINFLS